MVVIKQCLAECNSKTQYLDVKTYSFDEGKCRFFAKNMIPFKLYCVIFRYKPWILIIYKVFFPTN
jgi:hypothetical protein